MTWTFYVRSFAAIALVACLFLPLSTCTNRGQTKITIPIHDLEPMAEVLLVFCWPVLMLVAEALRPRLSRSAITLVVLQPLLAAATWYRIWLYMLFESPAIGAYIAASALAVMFLAATIEAVMRIRARMVTSRERTAAPHRSAIAP